MKTFIKWLGNKSKSKKKIMGYFPIEYKTYIEPFLGSGAIFLDVCPKYWIINDVNTDLMDLWKHIKDSLPNLLKNIKVFSEMFLELDRENKKQICKSIVHKLNNMKAGPKRSSYYLLMKYCVFLGILLYVNDKFYFRGLEQNFYNESYIPFFSKNTFVTNLQSINSFLNETNGSIHNTDYKTILKMAKKSDFVFMDPPYKGEKNYNFKYNSNENINDQFINELGKECSKLDNKNVYWLMTQADTPLVRKLFSKYNIHEITVYRRGQNIYEKELIIRNYK